MEDGVVRVLPALVQKPVARLSIVFKESVAVSIAVTIHPEQRGLDVWPDPLNEPSVTSSLKVRACQHNEQRRCVHRAVIAAEGHLSKGRHLTVSRLVQNLTWLRVLAWDDFGRLRRCQIGQDASCQTRVKPQTLQRRDNAIAAERRIEPRDAGVGIGSRRKRSDHHVQDRCRPLSQGVELSVHRLDAAELCFVATKIRLCFSSRLIESHEWPLLGPALATNNQLERSRLLWSQRNCELGASGGQPVR